MLTSAPGEHWRPAESLSQQSCCSWLVQCVQGMSSGRGHRGALRSGLGFALLRLPSTAQSEVCLPKGTEVCWAKGESPWCVPVSPGQSSCSSSVTLLCAAMGVPKLCYLPASPPVHGECWSQQGQDRSFSAGKGSRCSGTITTRSGRLW